MAVLSLFVREEMAGVGFNRDGEVPTIRVFKFLQPWISIVGETVVRIKVEDFLFKMGQLSFFIFLE